jgi:TonB family protein
MTKVVRVAIVAAVLSTAGVARAQEPSLATARELYIAAEYTDALAMLTALAGTNPSKADQQSIELYRALCLVALGNQPEATKVIEGIVTSDPLYRPDGVDLPPRMRTAFSEARKRLLPSIVQQRYLVAKAAFEQKEYATAAEGFKMVLDGLSDPELGTAGSTPPLSDLKMLASGFHDLATKAVPPPVPVEPKPAPVDVAPAIEPEPGTSSTPAAPAVADTAAGVPVANRVYEPTDMSVVPPITIRQTVPPFNGRLLRGATAAVEVIINEKGGVDSASMIVPLNPAFDRSVIDAARSWQYRPATLNGIPVKYRKRLQLSVLATGN